MWNAVRESPFRMGVIFRSERPSVRETQKYRDKTQTQDRKNPERRTDFSVSGH